MTISPTPPDGPQDIIPLQRHPGLYINLLTPKGRGVFTSLPIPSGSTIDICPVQVLDPSQNARYIAKTDLYHYTYNWPLSSPSSGTTTTPPTTTTRTTQAVVLGLGSMFNHSRHGQNVGWTRDVRRQVIVYRALRDIDAGEELCISYGDHLTFEDADRPVAGGEEGVDEDEVLKSIQLEPA